MRAARGGLLAALLVVLPIRSGLAFEADRPVVLLYGDAQDGPRILEELVPAIEAHLEFWPVTFRSRRLSGHIDGWQAALVAAELNAHTVLWLAEDEGHVFLLSPALGDQARSRPLAERTAGWVATCEAIATIVELEAEAALDAAVEPPPPEERPAPAPPPKPSTPVALRLRAGYTPVPVALQGPVVHGVSGALGLRIGRFVGFELSADATSPIGLGDAQVVRVPVRAAVVGTLPIGIFEPSLALGGGIEFTRIEGWTEPLADATVLDLRTVPLLVANLRAAWRVTPWLAPYVLGGVDATAEGLSFELGGQALTRRDPVVLHASAGLVLHLDLRPRQETLSPERALDRPEDKTARGDRP